MPSASHNCERPVQSTPRVGSWRAVCDDLGARTHSHGFLSGCAGTYVGLCMWRAYVNLISFLKSHHLGFFETGSLMEPGSLSSYTRLIDQCTPGIPLPPPVNTLQDYKLAPCPTFYVGSGIGLSLHSCATGTLLTRLQVSVAQFFGFFLHNVIHLTHRPGCLILQQFPPLAAL